MNGKQWLDHTVYRVYGNDDNYWEAAILHPTRVSYTHLPLPTIYSV